MVVKINQKVSSIDDLLFRPLAKFLVETKVSMAELGSVIAGIGLPSDLSQKDFGNYIGFIAEANVKWKMSKYSRVDNSFRPALHENQKIWRYRFETDVWGNISIFAGKNVLTEIDGLWEYSGCSQSKIPIVFEIKAKKGAWSRANIKSDFVSLLYGCRPYLCKIRSCFVDERPGLNIGKYTNRRKIIVPRTEELSDVAYDLFAKKLFAP